MDETWYYEDLLLKEYLNQITDEVDTLQSIDDDYLRLDLDVIIDKRRKVW